jgi:ribosomal protein S18 acetylase RimI-like enzyme
MNIHQRYNLNFTSYNYPVKPFTINTDGETLTFKEIDYKKPIDKDLLNDVSEFFVDSFVKQSSNPSFNCLRKDTAGFDKEKYEDFKNTSEVEPIKEFVANDDDTTLLVGYNDKNEISAAIFTHPVDIPEGIKEKNTLYVDSIAISSKYRGHHVGKIALDNLLMSSKNRFSDAILEAYNESALFYEKLGFNKVKDENAIEKLAKTNSAYPEYESFYEKPLDKTQSRWTDRLE